MTITRLGKRCDNGDSGQFDKYKYIFLITTKHYNIYIYLVIIVFDFNLISFHTNNNYIYSRIFSSRE